MSQDYNNQTILSGEQRTEQLDELELQAITGGCEGCTDIKNQAKARADEFYASEGATDKVLRLRLVQNNAGRSASLLDEGRLGICRKYSKHAARLMDAFQRAR